MATNVLNVKNPLLDEDEIIKAAQPESFEVQTRAFLDNVGADYNLSSADLGWKKENGVGQILINGNPFTTADRVENGISFVDNEKIKSDFDKYVKTYSLKSTSDLEEEAKAKYDIGNFGYNDPYEDTMKYLTDLILNPKPFSYDSASDPSFQSYKEQYGRAGDRALANTMSEATGMTGGRLNSWAVSAGQQAKENFDQKLMDVIPQLENIAYNRYQDGITNNRNNLSTIMDIDNEAFRRASDSRDFTYGVDYDIRENQRLANETKYNRKTAAEQTAYERAEDAEDDAIVEREWKHDLEREAIDDARYVDELSYKKAQDADANARAWANYGLNQAEFAWRKSTDARDFEYQKTQDELEAAQNGDADLFTIGAQYYDMMTSKNPSQWLIENAPDMTPDELFSLHDLMPDTKNGSMLESLIEKIYQKRYAE